MGGHIHHISRDQSKSLMGAVFETAVKQHLHAEADTHRGFSVPGFLCDDLAQTAFFEFSGGIFKRSHAGKNDLIGVPKDFLLRGDDGRNIDHIQRTVKGKQIPDTIIYDSKHLQHSFGRRNNIRSFFINGSGLRQSTAEPLERGFDNVM